MVKSWTSGQRCPTWREEDGIERVGGDDPDLADVAPDDVHQDLVQDLLRDRRREAGRLEGRDVDRVARLLERQGELLGRAQRLRLPVAE